MFFLHTRRVDMKRLLVADLPTLKKLSANPITDSYVQYITVYHVAL